MAQGEQVIAVTAAKPRRGGAVLAFTAVVFCGLIRCGGRTELFSGAPVALLDASAHGDLDGGGDASSRDGGCGNCRDDAMSDVDGGRDAADSSAVPLGACLGGSSSLVVSDSTDPYFDENLRGVTWTARLAPPNYLTLEVDDTASSQDWSFVFAGPADGGVLGTGSYDDAESPAGPGVPQLYIAADGMGCDQTRGSFQIDSLEFDDAGAVRAFAATFAQQCVGVSGGGLTLTGCVYLAN